MSKASISEKTTLISNEKEDKQSFIVPYLQLARVGRYPLGTYFIFWPFAWGLTLAAYRTSLPINDYFQTLLALVVASSLIHTTICTLNDICDKDVDAQVERTKNRPLPSGRITVRAAVMFLLFQVAACLGLVYLWARPDELSLALITLFPLHGLYPLMKRVTYWPQVWLGLSAAAGFALSWQHITHSIDWTVVGQAGVGIVCWVIHFDTVYASQDRADDLKANIGSTALLFGSYIRPILSLFVGGFCASLAIIGMKNYHTWVYFMGAVGSAVAHLSWQLISVDFEDKKDCMEKFISNGTMGYFIWGGMIADYLVKMYSV